MKNNVFFRRKETRCSAIQGRKEGRTEGRKEGRKEGRTEGRKEGRKEGRRMEERRNKDIEIEGTEE